MITSRPVFSCPSTCTTMRSRRPFSSSVCCVSARPSSHGAPACLIDVSRAAPVPPSWPRDQHHVGVRLRHACRDGADADLGDELHVHACAVVRVLQVVDELLQILDRIDVVVRRRRDQTHPRRGVPRLRDPRVHLVAGQLAALAGLGALRHLDLQVVGVHEVLARDAEATRRDLLDRAAPEIAVGVGDVPVGILAALAGVRPRAEAVHRDREVLVRFLARSSRSSSRRWRTASRSPRPVRPRRSAPANARRCAARTGRAASRAAST